MITNYCSVKGYCKKTVEPINFPVSNASHAGYGKIGYGPTFGRGHDICTFSGTITSSGNAFSLNGHCNLGNSFNLNGENKNTITNNNMKVTDLEVYKVIGKICYYYWCQYIKQLYCLRCHVKVLWKSSLLHGVVIRFNKYRALFCFNLIYLQILLSNKNPL